MNAAPLAPPETFDSIDVGFLLCVSVFAALLIAGLFALRRWRAKAGQPDPRRRQARGTNFVADAQRDESYQPPPHLAERAEDAAECEIPPRSSSEPPPLKQPRPLLSCPRCGQVVLGDAALAGERMVCPMCGCKFYPPRVAL